MLREIGQTISLRNNAYLCKLFNGRFPPQTDEPVASVVCGICIGIELGMKRSDIKKGTFLLLFFSVAVFAAIHIIYAVNIGRLTEKTIPQAEGEGILWSDTLSNKSSDIAALKPMDEEVSRFIGKWEIKGMSIAVTRHDSLLYAKGYGYADRQTGEKMDASSIMRMASASKLVTAVGIMKLCEMGKLNLGDTVFGERGILNDTSFTNAIRDRRIFDITVDHLLRHKGGFTLGAGDPMFNTKDIMAAKRLDTPPDNHQLTRIVLGRRLGFSPGCGRRYSNFGYMLLSLVIEKVAGQAYWDFIREWVLEPAGAYQFRPATNYYAERHARETRYYPPDDELVEEFNGSGRMVERVYGGSNVNALLGAGGWVASASDLARLVCAIDGEPGVGNVINDESISSMTAYDEDDNMSRGWSEVRANGRWIRTGTLSSTHAFVERFPDGDCWVILTNSGVWTGHHFSNDLYRLVERLRERYGNSFPHRNLW